MRTAGILRVMMECVASARSLCRERYGRGRMRAANLLTLVALGTLGVFISACGGGGHGPVSKARAAAFANVVNLHDDDVRGMTRVDAGFEIKGGAPPFGSCTTRVLNSDEVIAVSSPRFRRSRGQSPSNLRLDLPVLPVEGVRSLVYVMRQPDLASRNLLQHAVQALQLVSHARG